MSVLVNDSQWQCTVVILTLQTLRIYNKLLQTIDVLPDNFTLVTRVTIDEMAKLGTSRKSHRSSKTGRSSKTIPQKSKQLHKSKLTNTSKKNVKEVETSTENEKSSCNKLCLLIKKYILSIKTSDTLNDTKQTSDENLNKTKNKPKKRSVKKKSMSRPIHIDNMKPTAETDKVIRHRFIILWGFYDTQIPEELLKLKIPVKATIHVTETSYVVKPSLQKTPTTSTATKITGVKANKLSIDDEINHECSIFLEEMDKCIGDIKYLENNRDLLFLKYTTSDLESRTEEDKNKFKFNLLRILHGIKEAWEKFEKYKEIIQIQEIPSVKETIKVEDAHLYATMVSMVPLECVTIPVIMHCMLEQVVFWDKESLLEQRSPPSQNENEYLDSNSSKNEPMLSSVTTENITPIIIDQRDDVKCSTFHLSIPEFDFEQININTIKTSPIFSLWKKYPPHTLTQSKWYEFQLDKLRKYSDNRLLNLNKFYLVYLHQSLMNILILKIDQVLKSDDINNDEEESDTFFFSGSIEPNHKEHLDLFVKEIICNILCKIPMKSLHYLNYSKNNVYQHVSGLLSNATESKPSTFSTGSNWSNLKSRKVFKNEHLLQKKRDYIFKKLNKVELFLFPPEFVNLFETLKDLDQNQLLIDNMFNYEFIVELNSNTMCQSLQKAFQSFLNVNFYYFAPTDSILLWFNNNAQKAITISEKNQHSLETPLGFRDFYKYKLGGKTNLVESTSKNHKTTLFDEVNDELGRNLGHESHTKINDIHYSTTYNIGGLRMAANESLKYFFSADGSNVIVKKSNYFSSSKSNIKVTVNKNDTSLSYEFKNPSTEKCIKILTKFCNGILMSCILQWKPILEYSYTPIVEYDFKLNCSLSISIPSGLLVEVVPTDSVIGPFYIRQTYLEKGPACSSIWKESYRCYLNNGTIIIFNLDSSVNILYSNGTSVKCTSLNFANPNIEAGFEENVSGQDISNDEKKHKLLVLEKNTSTKVNENSKKKKIKGSKKANDAFSTDYISSQKGINSRKNGTKESLKSPFNDKENHSSENISTPVYTISEHSVLSWDGEYVEFKDQNLKHKEKHYNLRMAFDCINQELYLQRSDGMKSLLSSECMTVTYIDGSKITLSTKDNKEISMEDGSSIKEGNNHIFNSDENSLLSTGSSQQSFYHSNGVNDSEIGNGITENLAEDDFVYVECKYILEHKNYGTVKYLNDNLEAELVLPGNFKIIIDKNILFQIVNDNERITLSNSSLLFDANVLRSSTEKSSTTLQFKNIGTTPTVTCHTFDCHGNLFSVDESGSTSLLKSDFQVGAESEPMYHPLQPQTIQRFFVFNRDFTGYEFIYNDQVQDTYFSNDSKEKNSIKIPFVENNYELFSLYTQTPIYRNKSEDFLMNYSEEKILTSITRKDLLKLYKMPTTVWFDPQLSSMVQTEAISTGTLLTKIPKAIIIEKKLKIKKHDIDQISWFTTTLKKYMKMSEVQYNNYLNYYCEETRNEENSLLGEQLTKKMFDRKSYFLLDNLPHKIK